MGTPEAQRTTMPKVFRQVWAGECRWDLDAIPSLVATYQRWLEVFTDPNDKYDGPWQGKFPVLEVALGHDRRGRHCG